MDEDWGHEQIQWRGINCYRPSQVRDQVLQIISGNGPDVKNRLSVARQTVSVK